MNVRRMSGVWVSLCLIASMASASRMTVESDSVRLTFKRGGTFTVTDRDQEAVQAIGRLAVFDGQAQVDWSFDEVIVQQVEGHQVRVEMTSPGLRVQADLSRRERVVEVQWQLESARGEELWLEPRIELALADGHGFTHCWTGVNFPVQLQEDPIERRGILNPDMAHQWSVNFMPFPVAATFGPARSLFAGSLPFDPVSHYSAVYQPPQTGSETLAYSLRGVVSPEGQWQMRMLLGTATAAYGATDAIVQAYYDSYPEHWAPAVGQDNPFIWGMYDAHASNRLGLPDGEYARRLQQTLEWFYAPFKRGGDMTSAEEALWNYTPAQPMGWGTWRPIGGQEIDWASISRVDYRNLLREGYLRYGQDFGWMIYLGAAGQLCEVGLARDRYRDAIAYDENSAWQHFFGRGGMSGYDDEVFMLPLGTSFGRKIREDAATLARELHLPGYALDLGTSGIYAYRGPAVKQDIPGRAWDDKGVFIDNGVAFNLLVDDLRRIPNPDGSDQPMVVWVNGYLKGDLCMSEANFLASPQLYDGKTNASWTPLQRYLIGPRPTTLSGGYYRFSVTVRDWAQLDVETFKRRIGHLANTAIMKQFELGYSTQYQTIYGAPQVAYMIPEMIELVRAGWQASVPVRIEGDRTDLLTARYGRGAGTYLFFGYLQGDDRPLTLGIDGRELGGGHQLWVRKMRRTATTNSVARGPLTVLCERLTAGVPALYESICTMDLPDGVHAQVSADKRLEGHVYTVRFRSSPGFASRVEARQIRGYSLSAVRLGTGEFAFETVDDRYVVAEADIPAGDVELSFEYRSDDFHLTREQLLAFPFVDGQGKVAFDVELPEVITVHPNAAERKVAGQVADYFRFCAERGVIAADSPRVPVRLRDTTRQPGAATVRIIVGKDEHFYRGVPYQDLVSGLPVGVSMPEPDVLLIRAQDAAQAQRLWKSLAGVMDERFVYHFPFVAEHFPRFGHDDAKVIRHFDLEGRTLPWAAYFDE